jgi:hypothetical protein
MEWINLADYRDKWRVIVNAVVNLRVPQNFGKFLINYATSHF